MRNKKRILILAAVAVLLFAGWYFIDRLPKEPTGEPSASSDTPSYDVLDAIPYSQSDMTRIVMETPEGKLTMEKAEREKVQKIDNGDGTVTETVSTVTVWESDDLDLDTAAASAIAFAGGYYKTLRRIVETPTASDLTDFGFDRLWQLTFTFSGGESISVRIGNETQDGNGYYVMVSGHPSIYTAGAYTTSPMMTDRLGLINKKFYGLNDTLYNDVDDIRITRDGNFIAAASLNEEGLWYLSEPREIQGDNATFMPMAGAFAAVAATEHVELVSEADLGKYGLSEPKYVYEYFVNGQPHTLKLGNREPESNFFYALMDETDTVFTLDPTPFTFLDKPFVELIDKFLFIPTIYDVTWMKIELDGRTDILEFDVPKPIDNPDGDKPESYRLNGETLEARDSVSGIKRYYQGAIGIRADRVDFDVEPDYDSSKAVITIEYRMRNRTEDFMRVELIPTPDGYGYYGMRNGEYSGYIISKTQMDESSMGIRQGYVEMMEKIEGDKQKALDAETAE